MDFELTEEQKAVRNEMFDVCRELAKKQPSDWIGTSDDKYRNDEHWEYERYCAKEFAKRGWLSIDWPKECGGQGSSRLCKVFLNEARGYYRVPGVDVLTVGIAIPAIIEFGTEEQKRELLPPVASGDSYWCILFSEPDAGSDVANASTRGVRKGDVYVVNGQKTWTTGAHRADWGFLLFRTDPDTQPKHRGLSCIALNMSTPGVTVSPLYRMDFAHTFNEVFLDDVEIPVKYLIDEENAGWRVMRATMNAERSSVGAITTMQRDLEDLVEYCNNTKVHGEPLSKNSLIRNRIAEIACELEAARALSYRIAWMQDVGIMGSSEASAIKIFAGELSIRLAYLGNEILGPYGQVKASKWAHLKGFYEEEYQNSFASSIAAGTNEIQRNVIAWEGLGLPRMR